MPGERLEKGLDHTGVVEAGLDGGVELGGESRVLLDRSPGGDAHTATGGEHSAHLLQNQDRIGEAMQCVLTGDDIEGAVGEGQSTVVPLLPVDGAGEVDAPRRGYSDGGRVDAYHQTGRSHYVGREPGEDAGATGHIEHTRAADDDQGIESALGEATTESRIEVLGIRGR